MPTDKQIGRLLLRPADASELPALEPLYDTLTGALFAPLRRAGLFAALPQELRHPLHVLGPDAQKHRCVVAEAEHGIVGLVASRAIGETVEADVGRQPNDGLSAMFQITPGRSLHISALAVLPGFRRQGIARRLLTVAEVEAQALDLPKLSVTMFQNIRAGYGFLEVAGFEPAARIPPPGPEWQSLGEIRLLERAVPD